MSQKRETSPQLMKNINQQKVLSTIFQNEPISRVEIAELLGLTQQTITNIVNRLLDEGAVIEDQDQVQGAQSGAGRKPIPIRINRAGMFAVGVELAVNRINAVLIDFDNRVIKRVNKSVQQYVSESHSLECLFQVIDNLLESFEYKKKIKGICVSVQGLINQEQGVVLSAKAFHWSGMKLKDALLKKYDYPVFLENDVNAIAIAENTYGALASSKNNITIKLDYGVGGAIVFQKMLYSGHNQVAGEFGHYKIAFGEEALLCGCGGRGCLTTVASIGALQQKLGFPFQDIVKLLHAGDERVRMELDKVGRWIGISLGNLVSFLSPDQILFTGALVEETVEFIGPIIEEQLKQVVAPFCVDYSLQFLPLKDGAETAAGIVIKEAIQIPSLYQY